MDFSLFFINYTFLTLFVVIISNRIMKYIHLLITMLFFPCWAMVEDR